MVTKTAMSNEIPASYDQTLDKSRTLVAAGFSDVESSYLGYLKSLGYLIEEVESTKGLHDHILTHIPNVLLLDVDYLQEACIELTQKLKDNPLTYTMPIIIVIGERNLRREIASLEAGAEDFVVKPFSPEVLAARIDTSMRRNIRLQISNPLTGLPGAIYIEEQATKRLEAGRSTAMCYADLDYFKAFNDKYGYSRGDNVIRILATILHEGVSMYGSPGDFVGHVGGDDFVMMIDHEHIDNVCNYVTQSFDTLIPFQYDEADMERGYIVSINRLGDEMQFPMMTVSIGVVSNERREIDNYLLMTELAAEMKEYAKSLSKSMEIRRSIYRVDQRTH